MVLPAFETLLLAWCAAGLLLAGVAFAIGFPRASRDRTRERGGAGPQPAPSGFFEEADAPEMIREAAPAPAEAGGHVEAPAPLAEPTLPPIEAAPLQVEPAAPPIELEVPPVEDLEPPEPPPAEVPVSVAPPAADWRGGLRRSRLALMGRLEALFRGRGQLDSETLDQVEEVLFGADIGVRTAEELLEVVRRTDSPDAVRVALEARALEMLRASPRAAAGFRGSPHVVLVVGVNGSGKTTTVGKLAARWVREGQRVLVVAGDTFRAAATEQLEVWAERAGAEFVRAESGRDPAAVAYDAIKLAQDGGLDAVLVDTAGRLQTRTDLMDELSKIGRVVKKAIPDAPHEVLLVLDANVGQNAIRQAQEFSRAVLVSGIVLTKLDGTAKGGVVLGVAQEVGIPVQYVGLGEGIDDLVDFDPEEFVQALFETGESPESVEAQPAL